MTAEEKESYKRLLHGLTNDELDDETETVVKQAWSKDAPKDSAMLARLCFVEWRSRGMAERYIRAYNS